jgi:hypothetical protein
VSTKPLEELYFTWLYRQVANPDIADPSLTYWKLLKELFTKEFVWLIPNDDNRIEDGKDLRIQFAHEEGLDAVEDIEVEWAELGCSVLELMIGISNRLTFEAGATTHYWFWKLMENLGINRYSDDWRLPRRHVEKILDRVIFRNYRADGQGGFFPLKHPDQDQRKVELWYQMAAYILELE